MKAPSVLLGNRGDEGAELGGIWGGSPSPVDKGVWVSVVSSPIGVRGRALDANDCLRHNSSKSNLSCIKFALYQSLFHTYFNTVCGHACVRVGVRLAHADGLTHKFAYIYK